MVVLMSNLVAASLCPAPALHGTATDPLLGALIICTVDGAETIPADGQNAPPAQPCQLCTTVIGPSLVPVVAALAWLLTPLNGRWLGFSELALLAASPRRAGLSRASSPCLTNRQFQFTWPTAVGAYRHESMERGHDLEGLIVRVHRHASSCHASRRASSRRRRQYRRRRTHSYHSRHDASSRVISRLRFGTSSRKLVDWVMPQLIEAASQHIHAHSIGTIQSANGAVAYGVTNDWTLALRLPHVRRTNIREGHHEHVHDVGRRQYRGGARQFSRDRGPSSCWRKDASSTA